MISKQMHVMLAPDMMAINYLQACFHMDPLVGGTLERCFGCFGLLYPIPTVFLAMVPFSPVQHWQPLTCAYQ